MTKEISIQVRTDAFAKQFRWVDRFVEGKKTIPILAHVCMKFDGPTGILELSGTDLENAGTALVQRYPMFSQQESFGVTVPSKSIVKMLAQVKGVELLTLTYRDTVTVTQCESTDPDKKGQMVDVENHAYSLAISDGASTMTFDGMSVDSYPELPTIETPLCRIGGDAAKFLRRTIMAISDDHTRFTLRSGLLELTPTGPDVLVSTDGHRLSMQFVPTDYTGEETVRVLINKDFLRHAIATIEDSDYEDLNLFHNDGHVKAYFPGRVILGRKLTGNFPDYQRVVPKEFSSIITLERGAVLNACKKFPILVKEQAHKPVTFKILMGNVEDGDDPATLLLSARSDSGTVEARCACEMDPVKDFKTGFNIDYVIEAASLMPDKFEWGVNEGVNASELRAPEEGWRCIIMPVRV